MCKPRRAHLTPPYLSLLLIGQGDHYYITITPPPASPLAIASVRHPTRLYSARHHSIAGQAIAGQGVFDTPLRGIACGRSHLQGVVVFMGYNPLGDVDPQPTLDVQGLNHAPLGTEGGDKMGLKPLVQIPGDLRARPAPERFGGQAVAPHRQPVDQQI